MNTQTIIDRQIPIIASFSGGKDSTALVLYLLYESGIPKEQIHIVFADTGWEHHYTYFSVLKMAERHPVQIVRSKKYPGGMRQLMSERGIPTQKARFCTSELKVFPVREYQKRFEEFVSAKGIRREEATANNNRNVSEFELDYGTMRYSWYPIADYTLQDVWDIHHKYSFPVNKLYTVGCFRVGCFPCIYSVKNELALCSKYAPEHIDIIRQAENQRNFAYISPSGKPKVYYNRVANNGRPYASIDSILIWAKTDRKDHKYHVPEDTGTCSEGVCE
jgi:3'-phosphoadenosine 5'-phosphosulfate sulfotransferase (PAPS reductase)/FAD synthetase